MRLVTDPQRVIAHVVALRAEEEKPAEAVAAEAATPAEPEVIKKGKKEAEEGEEGAEAEEKPRSPRNSRRRGRPMRSHGVSTFASQPRRADAVLRCD